MFLRIFFSLALFVFSNSYSQNSSSVDTTYANEYYKSRINFFQTLPDRENEIVFLGNSITEAGPWQDMIAIPNILNRGISGDNSYGVYNRLREIIDIKPAKVFLMIGVNDIKRGIPLENIENNHRRIIKYFQKHLPSCEIYLQSILPVHQPFLADIYKKIDNRKINKINEELEKISEQFQVPYLNINKDIFSDKKGQLKREFTTDGLHLNYKGYLAWSNYLKKNNYLLE